MWLVAKYKPTSLFSLKDSNATSMGGKSLICPSPYSIKMAIINSYIQLYSVDELQADFKWIKDLEISIRLPQDVIVNNCFIRIQNLKREETKKEGSDDIFQSTVAFREFIYFKEPIEVAIEITKINAAQNTKLESVLKHINYFGKRGSFFQIISQNSNFFNSKETLEYGYSQELSTTKYLTSILYEVDDFGEKIQSFDQVNNYAENTTHRKKIIWCFPYNLISSSKSYYHYRLLNNDN